MSLRKSLQFLLKRVISEKSSSTPLNQPIKSFFIENNHMETNIRPCRASETIACQWKHIGSFLTYCKFSLHKNPAAQNSARRGQWNTKEFFEPETLYKEIKCLLAIDQKGQCKWNTCLKGSQAVQLLSNPHAIPSGIPLICHEDISLPGCHHPQEVLPAQVQMLWPWPSPGAPEAAALRGWNSQWNSCECLNRGLNI